VFPLVHPVHVAKTKLGGGSLTEETFHCAVDGEGPTPSLSLRFVSAAEASDWVVRDVKVFNKSRSWTYPVNFNVAASPPRCFLPAGGGVEFLLEVETSADALNAGTSGAVTLALTDGANSFSQVLAFDVEGRAASFGRGSLFRAAVAAPVAMGGLTAVTLSQTGRDRWLVGGVRVRDVGRGLDYAMAHEAFWLDEAQSSRMLPLARK
jgi:hypothetical protein